MIMKEKWKGFFFSLVFTEPQYMYFDSKLLAPVVYFAKPIKTSIWDGWAEQQAQ